MYNQSSSFPMNNFAGNFQQQSFSSMPQAGSQYRGMQRSFQPSGMVQSFYGQSQGTGYTQAQPQSYHMAHYRGNQQDHDSYLRSDSQNPAQQGGFRSMGSSFSSFGNQGMMSNMGISSQYGNQAQSSQSYHLPNYRGNQQGHDDYLGDSLNPSQSARGFGMSSFGQTQSGIQSGIQGGIQSGIQSQFQNQYSSPQQYHTANYVGNQPNHDQYLRSDSNSPNQSGMSRSSFRQF